MCCCVKLLHGELSLHAMSMVYTPCCRWCRCWHSVSGAQGFGVHNRFEPLLHQFLEPLGPQGTELAGEIIAFVAKIDVGVLGGLGLGMLIYTSLSLLEKIETSLNHVWQIARLRRLGQRLSTYLSVC